jgi:hypothetical protein
MALYRAALLRDLLADFVRRSPLRRAKAERQGFEPWIPFDRYTHFPGVPLQPLEHLSVRAAKVIILSAERNLQLK